MKKRPRRESVFAFDSLPLRFFPARKYIWYFFQNIGERGRSVIYYYSRLEVFLPSKDYWFFDMPGTYSQLPSFLTKRHGLTMQFRVLFGFGIKTRLLVRNEVLALLWKCIVCEKASRLCILVFGSRVWKILGFRGEFCKVTNVRRKFNSHIL